MKQKPNKPAPAARVSEVSALPPEVRAGQSIGLLQRLHILTREGKLNQDSRRKLKQVYHLVGFIEKPLQAVLDERLAVGDSAPITLVDHGAGKSYLGFILYDLFDRNKNPLGTRWARSLGLRPELSW